MGVQLSIRRQRQMGIRGSAGTSPTAGLLGVVETLDLVAGNRGLLRDVRPVRILGGADFLGAVRVAQKCGHMASEPLLQLGLMRRLRERWIVALKLLHKLSNHTFR